MVQCLFLLHFLISEMCHTALQKYKRAHSGLFPIQSQKTENPTEYERYNFAPHSVLKLTKGRFFNSLSQWHIDLLTDDLLFMPSCVSPVISSFKFSTKRLGR